MDLHPIGQINVIFGWTWMNLGFLTGLLLGVRAEPFGLDPRREAPQWRGGYASTERRLFRLGHIAFVMLSLLNVVFGQCIDAAHLAPAWKQAASASLIFGAVGMPLLCFASARWRVLKVLLGLPATAILGANLIIAWGMIA